MVSRFQAQPRSELAIPSVVLYELEHGTRNSGSARRRMLAQGLLATLADIPFDREAALAAARIRTDLESKGHTIGPLDLLIAGTALSRDATLATSNTKEFSRIRGLPLVDWRQPGR